LSKFTKPEREYVKGIVQNLSFQRFTDSEIVQWLHEEKKIDLDRSTVTRIRNHLEQESEKWYIELRESGAKYIAIYKERLGSLLSYQKKLHEVINQSDKSPELVIRAISELHRIEISLHTLLKELPGDIATSKDKPKSEEKEKRGPLTYDEWITKNPGRPRIADDSYFSDEENGQYYWGLHKKYNEYVKEWENSMFGPDPPKSLKRLDPTNPWSDNYEVPTSGPS
jgi:hypothetical protein